MLLGTAGEWQGDDTTEGGLSVQYWEGERKFCYFQEEDDDVEILPNGIHFPLPILKIGSGSHGNGVSLKVNHYVHTWPAIYESTQATGLKRRWRTKFHSNIATRWSTELARKCLLVFL